MATKVYATGNYIRVEIDGSDRILQDSKYNVVVYQDAEDPLLWVVESPIIGQVKSLVGDLQKSGGAPYDAITWDDFYLTNTGFNPAAGGSAANVVTGGLFDYNDAATLATPISVVGGAGFVVLTNDELGPSTNKAFPPPGVSNIWNAAGSVFDFTQLLLGDTVDIRLELFLTTASVNTEVCVILELGQGVAAYSVPFISDKNYKSVGVDFQIDRWNGVYMGDALTLDNPAQFKIKSDKTCTVVVSGWYCRVLRRAQV